MGIAGTQRVCQSRSFASVGAGMAIQFAVGIGTMEQADERRGNDRTGIRSEGLRGGLSGASPRLIPLLQSAATRIDTACELPEDVLDAMHAAGMFRLLNPHAYGGFELKPSEYVWLRRAIAIGDASAAWCMNQGSGCSMTSAYLEPEVRGKFGAANATCWHGGRGLERKRFEPRAAGGAPGHGVLPRLPPRVVVGRDVSVFSRGRFAGIASGWQALGANDVVPARIGPD